MYSAVDRPSIPPGQLIRALLLQIFSSISSERQLMERLDYDLMFRWFVGRGIDDAYETIPYAPGIGTSCFAHP